MSKNKRVMLLVLGLVMVVASTVFISTGEARSPDPPAPASSEEEIRSLLTAYFDLRYRAMAALQLDDFGGLISSQSDAVAFFETEIAKLAIDIRHAALNGLRYVAYAFFLDFDEIDINETAGTASAVVSVSHDVVYEVSIGLNADNPAVSHLYNLDHTIHLRREDGRWTIAADEYTDYVWRMLRHGEMSAEDMLRNMEAVPLPEEQSVIRQAESICGLPDDESTHPYDRIGAMFYALEHIENYNPDYPDYGADPRFGDCTNFVSQALYEGGRVSMAFCDPAGPYCEVGSAGNLGWFFESADFRASAWTHVGKFYEFVLDPVAPQQAGWTEGPEGCEVGLSQIELGDVIQYEWGNGDGEWDHAVIVVDIINGIPYIASHSQDVGPEPYTIFPYQSIRFIRIERSDGYDSGPTPPPTPTPTPTPTPNPSPTLPSATQVVRVIFQGSDDGGLNPTGCGFSNTDNEVYLGACFDGNDIISGFRFEDIQIPREAHIVGAYVDFTVDGRYTAPITISISGEAIGDSPTFSEGNPPDNRTQTNYGVVWYITDTWELGEHRSSPDLTSVIQEIIHRSDWNAGQALSILIDNAGFANTRRVIAYERALFDPGLNAARLVISYTLDEVPTPTPVTLTPYPTNTPIPPTPVPTSPPTEVPWICTTCGVGCPDAARGLPAPESIPTGTSTPYANMPEAVPLSSRNTNLYDLTTLLKRVREEILATTEEGQRLTDLYYSSIASIVQVLIAEPGLADQSLDVMYLFVPYLQALLDGGGSAETISAEHVLALQAFLDALVENGDSELGKVITSEMERHPLEDLIGATMDEAFTMLNGYHLDWRPPLRNASPYRAQAGRTIPVKFELSDFQGNVVEDPSIFLQIVDDAGNIVLGPIGLSDSPNDGLSLQGGTYHYNLRTGGLGPGRYTLQVYFHSEDPNVPAEWLIEIRVRGHLRME
ncbi:MAG: amidase domain-containing protein [Anaerolineales bacterium]|nr:amidase domain-containing protein [Anaerolineales bacterium]